ncbi:MAG: hypothetical protein M5U12_21325 [Verrucomicrobia bacterium]|nr:hypothetical protein [Verrucomicrobiota bacterium]
MLRLPRRFTARILGSLALAAGAGLGSPSIRAAEVLLEEGFNTDGEAANPKRYTTTGRGGL